MAIRLLSVDVDGTLTNTKNQLTDATVRALYRAMDAGLTVVLNTGRDLSESGLVLDRVPEIPYLLGCTGAYLMDLRTKQRLVTHSMPVALAREVNARLRGYDAMVNLFIDNEVYNEAGPLAHADRFYPPALLSVFDTHHPVPDLGALLAARSRDVDKFYVVFTREEEQRAATQAMQGLPLYVTNAAFLDLEITAEDSDKGTILRDFAAHFGYAPEQIAAIGDSSNDIPMFRVAGRSIAMGNARDNVKSAAQLVAPDNEHDGFAWAIDRILEEN